MRNGLEGKETRDSLVETPAIDQNRDHKGPCLEDVGRQRARGGCGKQGEVQCEKARGWLPAYWLGFGVDTVVFSFTSYLPQPL